MPHSTRFNRMNLPLISYLIALLCIVVFYFQYKNENLLEQDISAFCSEIKSVASDISAMNKMVTDNNLCRLMIKRIEQRPDLTVSALIHRYFWFEDLTPGQFSALTAYVEQHHADYAKKYTASLKKDLVYFPQSVDPLKMLTSALAHGDIWHLIGNLIFFLAFAPAIEIVMARAWAFLGICIVIIVSSSLAYSASVWLGQEALPALGLSGLVMGMIGLFAALMPREKIRVFVWILIYFGNVYIPAWLLALWFIGWDSLNLLLGTGDPAINLVAHVAGAVTGYVLGYVCLKKRIKDPAIYLPRQ